MMAKKTGLTFDFRDFDMNFKRIVEKTIPGHAEKGLLQAGAALIRDAIVEEPTVPKKTGHLRRNQRIEVVKESGKAISVLAGFNTNYAAKLHEAPSSWNWSEPGSGPKYLESKLSKHKDKYMKVVADYIKDQGG